MDVKIFEVVLLRDGNKATVLSTRNNKILGEIVDDTGNKIKNRIIEKNEIVSKIVRK